MGLENRDNPALECGPRRAQGSANFRGMVRVVIEHQTPGLLPLDFEAALDPAKLCQGLRRESKINSQLERHAYRSKRVQRDVDPRRRYRDRAERLTIADHLEARG